MPKVSPTLSTRRSSRHRCCTWILAVLFLPGVSPAAELSPLAPVVAPDPAAILRDLRDVSAEGISRRLGPDYAYYHPGGEKEDFPLIYLRPAIPVPADATPSNKRHYQLGGPWTKAPGDFSSTQGQIVYVPDRPLVIDPKTHQPNEGLGVDRVTIIEMSNGCFTEKPEPPWWGGFRPHPGGEAWIKAANGKLGQPIAVARGTGNWSNSGLVLFSSGLIASAGTVTGHGPELTVTLPPTKLPTAISITNRNEFALVTVVDTTTMQGQVAVFALTSGGKKTRMPHEWADEYPGLANVAVFTRIKFLGYVDLPGITCPTGISAVAIRGGGRLNGRNGHAGMLSEYNLSVQADRDIFLKGKNAGFVATTGFAVVVAKHENKAAFLDLQALFAAMRTAYLTTEENFQKTTVLGDGPHQWPYTFEGEPDWKPTMVKLVDVTKPTAVLANMTGGSGAQAAIASEEGTISFYEVGGLATDAPAVANDIAVVSTLKVGRNPVCLAYEKYAAPGLLAVSRGDREVSWIRGWGKKATITRRLRDNRLRDPVYAEVADTHGIQTPLVTVADFQGRKIINYRYGVLIFATQNGAKFGVGPTGEDEFECGGLLEFPGQPFCISASNVN